MTAKLSAEELEAMQPAIKLCECGCGQSTRLSNVTEHSKGWVKGQPRRFVFGHKKRNQEVVTWYRRRRIGGVHKAVHVIVAEAALGKPLPKGACVHHVDENIHNNRNDNLVICPSNGYHRLLHYRTDVRDAGGNPNTQRLCRKCGQCKDPSEFHRRNDQSNPVVSTCKTCNNLARTMRATPSPATLEREL